MMRSGLRWSAVTTVSKSQIFRRLPAVDELLRTAEVAALMAEHGRLNVIEAVHVVLNALRSEISSGALDCGKLEEALSTLPQALGRRVEQATAYSLRRVINASGVMIHTNLGRAPLSRLATERIAEITTGYSNLEFDLAKVSGGGAMNMRSVCLRVLCPPRHSLCGDRSGEQQRRGSAAGFGGAG